MKSILLQAGHEGVTSGATGAPGEQAFTVRVRNKLSEVLLSKKLPDGTSAFTVQLINANPTDSEINHDYSLCFVIHYDADIYGTGGGFVDYADASVDYSNAESKRIKEAIESEYFKHSGIVNHPERSNPNTKFYYMWNRLSAKTPCVIIECGVGMDAHDKVILADPNIVPNAIARGICKAFNVPYDIPVPTPPTVDYKKLYEEEKKKTLLLSSQLAIANETITLLQNKISKAKTCLS